MYGKRINTVNLCADGLIQHFRGRTPDDELTPEIAEENMSKGMKAFADTGAVDVMLLNVNYHISYIPSQVWDTAWQRTNGEKLCYDDPESRKMWGKHFAWAHEKGVEPYGLAIKHTRANGMSPWFSVRMNEFHYFKWSVACASFWMEHPEYHVEEDQTFDYKHPEVRQYYIDYVTELCENWDIDGVELDMIRRFTPGSTQEDRDAVTDCVRRIRENMKEISARKGKKIKLSARVYSLPESCRDNWCDAVDWVQEGLVDGLTLSNFHMPCDFDIPFDRWRKEIGFAEGYFLQAGGDGGNFCAPFKNPYARALNVDTEMMRGFAESAWGNGADGVYVFNLNSADRIDFTCLRDSVAACSGTRRHLIAVHNPAQDGWELMISHVWQSIRISVGRPGPKAYIRLGVVEEPGQIDVRVDGHDCVSLGVIQPKPGEEYNYSPPWMWGCTKLTQAAPYMLEFDCGQYAPSGAADIEIRGEKPVQAIWAEVCFKVD